MKKSIVELFDRYANRATRKVFCNAKSPLILADECTVNMWLMPWNNKEILLKFKNTCEASSNTVNSQDNCAIYVVKASGCGKTKLALSLGLETEHIVIPIVILNRYFFFFLN